MITVSPKSVSQHYEVWLFASPDYRQPVQECGVCANELDAVHAARFLTQYLHGGPFNENMLDCSPDPVGDEIPLRLLPVSLAEQGIDPTRVYVGAIQVPFAGGDNAVPVPAEALAEWRRHAGHVQPEPVMVRAARRR